MAGKSCKGLYHYPRTFNEPTMFILYHLSLLPSLPLSPSFSPLILHSQVVSKHPLEANLSGKSLERVPKYFFLNYYLVAMNLSRNRMTENYTHTVTTTLGSHGKARVIGWINDLSYFRHLVSLSLSDNHLTQFPVSLCALKTLQVL